MDPPSSITINDSYERNRLSIVGRIKEGFNIWRKGWLSFILAEILLFITLVIIVVPTMAIAHYFGLIYGMFPHLLDPIIVFMLTIITVSFQAVTIGTMCGLGKELIEIEDTRAENTLHYIKKYGRQFVVIGLIIAAVSFAPQISTHLLLSALNIKGLRWLGILAFIVSVVLVAPLTLSMSAAVVDGLGPIESVKISFQAFRKDSRTVLLLFGFFTVISLALLSPTIGLRMMLAIQRFTPTISIVIAFVGYLFVLFPVMCITFTKLYYDYTIPKKKEVSEKSSPPIRML